MRAVILRVLSVAILALAGILAHGVPAAAAGAPAPPGKYYLSLGDSLAYGYQAARARAEAQATGTINPAHFNTGYSDDFYRMLQAIDPGIQLVDYGCPGQTSTEFISTPDCPTFQFPLHADYSTSQLQAALAFIAAHPGQVNPISVDLGANDVLRFVASCGGPTNTNCLAAGAPALFKQIGTNIAQVVGALRQAAPTAQILVVGLYNPLAAANPASNALAMVLNGIIQQAAAATGGVFVDTFTPFNVTGPQPATLCYLSLICTATQDIHASDAGYLTIAKAMWDASGFAAYAHGFFVTFSGATPGQGEVYFGSGPGCLGLVEVATQDLQPAGGTTHIVYVTGNDLPGTVGSNGIIPGVTYSYETVTITSSGQQVDNNGGSCYTGSQPAS